MSFNEKINDILNKYGSSISSDLNIKIEYIAYYAKSIGISIRMDMENEGYLGKKTIKQIEELFLILRDDSSYIENKYLKNVTGGYPVLIGKVIKSDAINGEILVESEFVKYNTPARIKY